MKNKNEKSPKRAAGNKKERHCYEILPIRNETENKSIVSTNAHSAHDNISNNRAEKRQQQGNNHMSMLLRIERVRARQQWRRLFPRNSALREKIGWLGGWVVGWWAVLPSWCLCSGSAEWLPRLCVGANWNRVESPADPRSFRPRLVQLEQPQARRKNSRFYHIFPYFKGFTISVDLEDLGNHRIDPWDDVNAD